MLHAFIRRAAIALLGITFSGASAALPAAASAQLDLYIEDVRFENEAFVTRYCNRGSGVLEELWQVRIGLTVVDGNRVLAAPDAQSVGTRYPYARPVPEQDGCLDMAYSSALLGMAPATEPRSVNVRAVVDTHDVVNESNETDNSWEQMMTVSSGGRVLGEQVAGEESALAADTATTTAATEETEDDVATSTEPAITGDEDDDNDEDSDEEEEEGEDGDEGQEGDEDEEKNKEVSGEVSMEMERRGEARAAERLVVRLKRKVRQHERQILQRERQLVKTIDRALARRMAGRILLQVEGNGEAWYVDPATEQKLYLQDGAAAYDVMRGMGLGMSDENLEKIPVGVRDDLYDLPDTDGDGLPDKAEEALGTDPTKADTDGDGFDDKTEINNGYRARGTGRRPHDEAFRDKFRGKIVLQVEGKGEAWYINPEDGKRYFLGDPKTAYNAMRLLSLGIKNDDLRKIEVGEFEEVQNAE